MSASAKPPGKQHKFRLAVAAAALAAVAAVAIARYYAAGLHEIYFGNSAYARTALARYLLADYGGAARNLRAHLRARPGDDAQDDPSYAAFLAGDAERAERTARETLRADPGATRPGITLAQLALERGRHGEALELSQALLAAAPERPINTLALVAIIETRMGEYERAIASWQRALRYSAPGTRLSIYAGALEAADGVLQAPPRAGRDALLAQIFLYLRYYDRSAASSVRKHARHAILAGDRAGAAWVAHGEVLAADGKADAALEAFAYAAALNPGDAEAHFRQARVLSDRGDLAGELRAARLAYAAAPDPVLAEWLLKLLGDKFGDYRSVVSIAGARLAEGRREHAVLVELGRAHGALGDFSAAIQAYAAALELQPRDAKTLADIAYWHARAGQREQAIAFAHRAAAERRDWSYPLILVAKAMAEDFRYADAIPIYEAAFRIEPPKNDDLAHLCTLYHGASRWRAGLTCFETVLRRDPRNARAQRMLAESRNNVALAEKREAAEKR
jgi:tetratricopeptide (TPR) repeat protein